LLILLLAFFGIRKRWYRSTFGTLEQWLQSHIYLGLLVLVILIFHTGMRFNDRVAVATLILVIIVVASGILGAILYVTVRVSDGSREQSHRRRHVGPAQSARARMARIASGRSTAFQRIHDELTRQTTPRVSRLAPARVARTTRETGSRGLGAIDRARAEEEQEDLRQMLVLSRQRKELLLRLVYQRVQERPRGLALHPRAVHDRAARDGGRAHRGSVLLRRLRGSESSAPSNCLGRFLGSSVPRFLGDRRLGPRGTSSSRNSARP
jgi:hypothetical protein